MKQGDHIGLPTYQSSSLHISYYHLRPFFQYPSIFSRFLPFVSGTKNQQKKKAITASKAYSQKVKGLPITSINERKVILMSRLPAQFATVEMLPPVPRSRVGNSSELSNQNTGPIPIANAMIYTSKPIKISTPALFGPIWNTIPIATNAIAIPTQPTSSNGRRPTRSSSRMAITVPITFTTPTTLVAKIAPEADLKPA